MKAFVQFLSYAAGAHPARIIPACGSDGVIPLDGRLGLARQIAEAKAGAERKHNVRQFAGFEIHRGDFRRSAVVYTHHFSFFR